MDCWTIVGSLGSAVGGIGSVIAIAYGVCTYKTNNQKEKIRATLTAFPLFRKDNSELILALADVINDREKELRLKSYLSQMELFATGINMDAYDLNTIDRMSGGMLITQYENHIKRFIKKRREKTLKHNVEPQNIYVEYENMMKKLFKMRGKIWVN